MHGHSESSNQLNGSSGTKAPHQLLIEMTGREEFTDSRRRGSIGYEVGLERFWRRYIPTPSMDDVACNVEPRRAMASTDPVNGNQINASGTGNDVHVSTRLALEVD